MRSRALPLRQPGGRRSGLLLLVVVVCAVTAVALPPARPPAVGLAGRPVATDLRPAPGAVVPAGPVVVAARVEGGAGPGRLHVDGRPAQGPAVDPDGHLSALRGVGTTLSPGRHDLAVTVDGAVVRTWSVVAAGVDIAVAREDAGGLLARLDDPGTRGGPAVVVDLDDPAAALAALPVLAVLDGVVVPASATGVAPPRRAQPVLSPSARDRLSAGLGAPVVVGSALAAAVPAGLPGTAEPVVVEGEGAAEVTAAATSLLASRVRAVVVGPAEPFAAAMTAAVAAARLRAGLLLIEGDGVGGATAEVLAGAPALLLSRDLTPAQRRSVTAAMAPGAVASDDDLLPGPASEGVVVPDRTDRARAIAAATAVTPGRPVLVGTAAARRWTAVTRPDRLTLLGPARPPLPLVGVAEPLLPDLATTPALDPDAVAATPVVPPAPGGEVVQDVDLLVEDLHVAWADGPDAPQVHAVVDDGAGLSVAVSADGPVSDAVVHVEVLGYEWPGTVAVDGHDVRWVGDVRPPLPLPLEPGDDDTPLAVGITAEVVVAGAVAHRRFRAVVGVDPADSVSPEGWVVAGGVDPPVGTGGRRYTYSVEVEPETGLDLDAVEAQVTRILTDPRSWTADGQVTWQRVGTDDARIRVVVARPATVDAYCGAVGLRTGGRVSCWDGYRAMLNLDRWQTGVSPFHTDLEVYRQYLVNHEVGHGLGHGHEFCPGTGTLAPVMQQQTGGLGACLANGWPFPDAG